MVTGRSMGRRTGGACLEMSMSCFSRDISFSIPWTVPAKKDNSVG